MHKMRFLHVSDLHIGKRLHEFSLEEDQRHILDQMLNIVDETHPDAVLIAGDVYDNSAPGNESMMILDSFLTSLSQRDCQVFMIPGNHDSSQKLGYGGEMFASHGIHVCKPFHGIAERHTLTRDGETVEVYMLPFVNPRMVRRFLPDKEIDSYGEAVIVVLENSDIVPGRKVILAHQFVIGAERSDSETAIVGNVDSMPVSVFRDFDYVALGHIHNPQTIGNARYCGSPLKYSKSEADREKSVTLIDLGEEVSVSTIPLVPLRDVRVLNGTVESIIQHGKNDPRKGDFIYAVLSEEPVDGMARLREVYPNTVSMEVPFIETSDIDVGPVDRMDPMELFVKVFEEKTGAELTESQMNTVHRLMEADQ